MIKTRTIAGILIGVFTACMVIAQIPYHEIPIEIQDDGNFKVRDRHYGSTPFFKFTVTDNGEDFDLSGWDFSLKYGYTRNAKSLVTLEGQDHISVTNNIIHVNGTTNFFFKPRRNYYVALQGTYTNATPNYSHTFSEGSMDVLYTPAGDPSVANLIGGLDYDFIRSVSGVVSNLLMVGQNGQVIDTGISLVQLQALLDGTPLPDPDPVSGGFYTSDGYALYTSDGYRFFTAD